MKKEDFNELIDSRFGDYVIKKILGVGGQAAVFFARSNTNNEVALKIYGMNDDENADLNSGFNEAKTQSLIRHSNVVTVYAPYVDQIKFNGRSRDALFIPMEYSPKGSCHEAPPFNGRKLDQVDIEVIAGLLDGLRMVHKKDLIHRDIKPANVLRFDNDMVVFGSDGFKKRETLKITDFGIARKLNNNYKGDPSGFTLLYMAPEQVDRAYSKSADIYSMGATLFYMITGRHPIQVDGDTKDVLVWQKAHLENPRPNAMEYNMNCPPSLALLIMRMMDPVPENRPTLDDCDKWLSRTISLIQGNTFSYSMPPLLDEALSGDVFPIQYSPEFKGLFKPIVPTFCGFSLYVVQVKMAHPHISQYHRLIKFLVGRYSDTFCFYETWGTYDVHVLVWSTPDATREIKKDLMEKFPGGKVNLYRAQQVIHVGQDSSEPSDISIVNALAVQEDAQLKDVNKGAYFSSTSVGGFSDSSVRAFTFVSAVSKLDAWVRRAILYNVNEKVGQLYLRKTSDGDSQFPWIELIELANDDNGSMVVCINYVCREFKDLYLLPTAIIQLGEDAVKTATFIETKRITIQSGKILLF